MGRGRAIAAGLFIAQTLLCAGLVVQMARIRAAQSHVTQAEDLMDLGKPSEAVQHARRAVQLDGPARAGHRTLVRALCAFGPVRETLGVAASLDGRWPGDPVGAACAARALSAQEQHAEAIAMCRRGLEHAPGSVELRDTLARALASTGRADEAAEEARRVLRCDVHFEGAATVLAEAEGQGGSWQGEVSVYRSVLSLDPKLAWAHAGAGASLLYDAWRPVEAERWLRRACQLAPDHYVYRRNLGVALCWQRRYAEAERELATVARQQPDDSRAHYWLGYLMMASKRYAEAVGELRRAVDLAPAQGPNWRALADAVISLGDQSTTRQTIAQMRAALQVQPAVADLHASLGRLLEAEEGTDAAGAALESALAVDPDCFSARYELARLAAAKGDSRTALSHLDHLSGKRLPPGDAELRERALAAIYTATGRAAEARGAIQAADAHKRQAQHPQ